MAFDLEARAALDGGQKIAQIAAVELDDRTAVLTDHVMGVTCAGARVGMAAVGLMDAADRAAFDEHVQGAVDGDQAGLRVELARPRVDLGRVNEAVLSATTRSTASLGWVSL